MSDLLLVLLILISAFVFSIFWIWLSCKLVKKGIVTDSFLLVVIGIWFGGLIPLIYYFWVRDKYQKLAKQKEESTKTANQKQV